MVNRENLSFTTTTLVAAVAPIGAVPVSGEGFAQPNPQPMFPNPPGLLRLEPYSEGLRGRIWWGAGSNATAVWAATHCILASNPASILNHIGRDLGFSIRLRKIYCAQPAGWDC
jgi:alkanesulfonate monooxygenase SsuD/methylene tetrahydromethanopterin reductase-like flavin-dependent oxidoreductase (luciferase family)